MKVLVIITLLAAVAIVHAAETKVVPFEENNESDGCNQSTGFRVHVKPHFALCCENEDQCKVKKQEEAREARGEKPVLHEGGKDCDQVMGFKVHVNSKYDLACQEQDPCKKAPEQEEEAPAKQQQQQEEQEDPCAKAEVVPREVMERAEAFEENNESDGCNQSTGFRVHVKPHFALCCENEDQCKVKKQEEAREARGEKPVLHEGGKDCDQVMGFKVHVNSKYDMACQEQDPCKKAPEQEEEAPAKQQE